MLLPPSPRPMVQGHAVRGVVEEVGSQATNFNDQKDQCVKVRLDPWA